MALTSNDHSEVMNFCEKMSSRMVNAWRGLEFQTLWRLLSLQWFEWQLASIEIWFTVCESAASYYIKIEWLFDRITKWYV